MKTFITTIIFLLCSSTAQAQYHPWWGFGSGADTAQSARLRGLGEVMHGQADRLRALGEYQQQRQHAYSLSLDNKDKRIRNNWAIKNDLTKRKAERPDALDRMEARFDKAERHYGLKQRENELIRQGVLPPKKKPSGIYLGKKYGSYAEFKLSDDYKNMIINRDIRFLMAEIDKKREKIRYDAAMRWMAKRRRMDPISRVFHDERTAIYSRARSAMGKEWWDKYMTK